MAYGLLLHCFGICGMMITAQARIASFVACAPSAGERIYRK